MGDRCRAQALAALAFVVALPATALQARADTVPAHVVRGLTQQLWRAIDADDGDTARRLIAGGADPDVVINGERMLHRALFRKKWAAAEALVDGGAQVSVPDSPGCERLRWCDSIRAALYATFNPPLLAKLKARGLDLDAVSATGHTALTALIVDSPMRIRAVGAGQAVGVAQSAATGEAVVRPGKPWPQGKVVEIAPPDNVARMKALLEAGADPNRKYRQLTPLMLVLGTLGRPPAMTDLLIAAGGRIEIDVAVPAPAKDRAGAWSQPPMVATVGGPAVLSVDADAPIAAGNYQGIETGLRVGPLTWAALMKRPDVALRLLERERRIAPADRDLLYFAAAAGSWELVLAALGHRAEANAANRAGVTPLMLAAESGRVDVVRALVAAGADVHARSDRSWPPLLERDLRNEIGAAIAGHSAPRPRLVGGYTALGAARERGHTDVVRVLEEAGAR